MRRRQMCEAQICEQALYLHRITPAQLIIMLAKLDRLVAVQYVL